MEVIKKTVGILGANCYILRYGDQVLVIDPGGNPEIIYPYIEGKELVLIINTHGHYDHIGANNDLMARYDTKIAVGEQDYQMLYNPDLNLSVLVDAMFISVAPEILLKDGDAFTFGGKTLRIIHTPGHTRGSVCIFMENVLFSGDTLFYHSVGRTDFPTGSFSDLEKSIKEKLYTLPDDTLVYTGHGENTTIGEEKKYNEFVRY